MFSLSKLAYMACSELQRTWYETVPKNTPRYDVKPCCIRLTSPNIGGDGELDASVVNADAAKYGHIECLLVARERGLEWGASASAAAASAGHLEILQYLCDNGCPLNACAPEAAAAGGHVDVLRYLLERGCGPDDNTMNAAARHDRVDCMRFCREVAGLPWTPQTLVAAASHGSINAMRYAFQNGHHRDDSLCVVAARNGHLQCLKYAHSQGCRLSWAVITMTNDQRCRDYCRDHVIERSVDACNSATVRGDLELLKYLYQNGYPLNESTWNVAYDLGRQDILDFLEDKRCPKPVTGIPMDF